MCQSLPDAQSQSQSQSQPDASCRSQVYVNLEDGCGCKWVDLCQSGLESINGEEEEDDLIVQELQPVACHAGQRCPTPEVSG